MMSEAGSDRKCSWKRVMDQIVESLMGLVKKQWALTYFEKVIKYFRLKSGNVKSTF